MNEFGFDHNNLIYETVSPQIAAHQPHPSLIKHANTPDVWRLRKTPPLVSFLVGWLDPMVFHIDTSQDTQPK
jgi:hypothetical protein